jgi:hypothetical protein
MTDPKLAVVIATCRPESFKRWIDAWKRELHDVMIYVVEDAPCKTDNEIKAACRVIGAKHYTWREIDEALGPKSWIIPRRTSAIKSYGFLAAHQDAYDYIWTLDDDCFPENLTYGYAGLVQQRLSQEQSNDSWFNTIGDSGLYPRGYPYGIRQDRQPVMIHHGLWSGVPDLDGITALEYSKLRFEPFHAVERVPTGKMFAMCGMNLVFRREMTPAMYFGLQGEQATGGATTPLPFDRFDDIWAGLFAKKVCDHLGYAVTSGGPSIIHTKESDPTMRVIKEGPGIAANEILWQCIANPYLLHGGHTTVKSCYTALARVVESAAGKLPYPDYWTKLAEAMQIWTELFE